MRTRPLARALVATAAEIPAEKSETKRNFIFVRVYVQMYVNESGINATDYVRIDRIVQQVVVIIFEK